MQSGHLIHLLQRCSKIEIASEIATGAKSSPVLHALPAQGACTEDDETVVMAASLACIHHCASAVCSSACHHSNSLPRNIRKSILLNVLI